MLRIEQGFDDTLFETSHPSLGGYTNHHRLLMPALAVYDLNTAGHSGATATTKMKLVMEGTLRSATLAFESERVKEAAHNVGWLAVREVLQLDGDLDAPWRVALRKDGHVHYPDAAVWSATRNLVKLPENAPDEASTRVRERYTFTALDNVGESDIREILDNNVVHDDVMLATATVYAINKTVAKPGLHKERIDMSLYPAIAERMTPR